MISDRKIKLKRTHFQEPVAKSEHAQSVPQGPSGKGSVGCFSALWVVILFGYTGLSG